MPGRRPIAVEIGEDLGEPQTPLDIGKAVEHDLKREGLRSDILAGAIELRDTPRIGQHQILPALGDPEHGLAAAHGVDPNDACQPRIGGLANPSRQNAPESVSVPEDRRFEGALPGIGKKPAAPRIRLPARRGIP